MYVSDVASAYLFTSEQLYNYESRQACIAIALSEHNGLMHEVEGRGLPPLDEIYLVVANRALGRTEVRHHRQMANSPELW